MADIPYRLSAKRVDHFSKRPEVQEHIAHVGAVTFAWARMQSSCYTLFLVLLKWDHKLAHGLWHCIMSDAYQRDLLMATARARLDAPGDRRHLDRIAWIVAQVAKLAQHRNDLVHTGLIPNWDEDFSITPDWVAGRHASAQRMSEATGTGLWSKVVGDLTPRSSKPPEARN